MANSTQHTAMCQVRASFYLLQLPADFPPFFFESLSPWGNIPQECPSQVHLLPIHHLLSLSFISGPPLNPWNLSQLSEPLLPMQGTECLSIPWTHPEMDSDSCHFINRTANWHILYRRPEPPEFTCGHTLPPLQPHEEFILSLLLMEHQVSLNCSELLSTMRGCMEVASPRKSPLLFQHCYCYSSTVKLFLSCLSHIISSCAHTF